MEGMIECMIIEGSFNTELFTQFIGDLVAKMQPFPAPNSVVVMDNCRIHKAPEIRELIESRSGFVHTRCLKCSDAVSRGLKLEFLPAYSPDFNPIELAFSLLKGKLRRYPPPSSDDFTVREYLYMQVFGISASDCKAFYHNSGYL